MSEFAGIDPSSMPNFLNVELEHHAAHDALHEADDHHFVQHMIHTMTLDKTNGPEVDRWAKSGIQRLGHVTDHVQKLWGGDREDTMDRGVSMDSSGTVLCGHCKGPLKLPTLLGTQGFFD